MSPPSLSLHRPKLALAGWIFVTAGTGLVMVAAVIPFSTSSFINLREFGIGVALAVLLEILILRPVLRPAAEVVLGRVGWWPTSSAGRGPSPSETRRRLHLPRLRHREVAHP